MDHRPNPEKLLQRVQAEERQKSRGKLKVYLGAAPGVGKTYTMLQDALAKRLLGLDVVIGIVETHGRDEISKMVKNFEILPRQKIDYRGHVIEEFDLDGALKRNPALILVDELAHSNPSSLRHTKRWQDVKEILDRGIDVYTTLNIQHIESLNGIVAQIIHTAVTETVPDSMLEMADTIELVDLPPEDLLKRLQEGKVYFPAQAELAKEHFFRKGNLIALRELALRTLAEKVGAQVLLYRQGEGIQHIWPTKEKILVCVGSRQQSSNLVRTAKRMAVSLQAEWIAVHIDTPRLPLSEEKRDSAIQNLRLAESLGAETRILTGFDVIKEIMHFAREQNVTMIMICKHIRPRWKEVLLTSLADEVVRHSGEIDVYIVTDEAVQTKTAKMPAKKERIPWRIYGISVGMVALVTAIDSVICPYLHTSNLIMAYLLGVSIVSLSGRVGPSLLASILSVLAYAYFFIPPYYTFAITNIQYLFTLIVMLLITQTISHLTILIRRQATAAGLAEKHTASLHTLSRQLASTRGVDKLLAIAVQYIGESFDSSVMAILADRNGKLVVRARYHTNEELSPKEEGVVQWVFDLGQVAGFGTDTLPYSDSIYVPLASSQGVIGVLKIHPHDSRAVSLLEEMHLLESCASQIALALAVDRLQEDKLQSEVRVEADKARSSLLQSVSHDLRTPLVAVMGAAATLMEMGKELDANKIKKLGSTIYLELEQLSRLINNLLQITYLEAESVKLQEEYGSLPDLINIVISLFSKKLGKKPILTHFPREMPKVPFDKTLLQEVFINLLDNAIKFTPSGTPIDILVFVEKEMMVVTVSDRGPGIVADEVNKLFEKFYRGRMLTTERGLGLGLAICDRIVKAHGGRIWAENRTGGGASFCFSLPLHTIGF